MQEGGRNRHDPRYPPLKPALQMHPRKTLAPFANRQKRTFRLWAYPTRSPGQSPPPRAQGRLAAAGSGGAVAASAAEAASSTSVMQHLRHQQAHSVGKVTSGLGSVTKPLVVTGSH